MPALALGGLGRAVLAGMAGYRLLFFSLFPLPPGPLPTPWSEPRWLPQFGCALPRDLRSDLHGLTVTLRTRPHPLPVTALTATRMPISVVTIRIRWTVCHAGDSPVVVRVLRPLTPHQMLHMSGIELAWAQASRGVTTAVNPLLHAGIAQAAAGHIDALFFGHHVRKRLWQRSVSDAELVRVLEEGLGFCSWDHSFSEARFTFVLRDLTVVLSECGTRPITVMRNYAFTSFRRRLRTCGPPSVRRPHQPDLYRLSQSGRVRPR